MSKERIFLILGIWVAVLPYLGFPYLIKNILFSITGLGIIYLSYLMYRKTKREEVQEKKFKDFSENNDFDKSKTKPE